MRRREGKSDFRNIIADLRTHPDIMLTESGQGGKVHRGFKEALDEVWEKEGVLEYVKSKDTLNRTLCFTGQSLGATLAANKYGKAHGL
ncbi:MAG: hypothetical protein ABSE05_15180 [Syntrophales bacterium]